MLTADFMVGCQIYCVRSRKGKRNIKRFRGSVFQNPNALEAGTAGEDISGNDLMPGT
jgi:hypothetical protein